MEKNIYNDFYAKKSVAELTELLRMHHQTGTTLDEQWYERLKIHFMYRDLNAEETDSIRNILSTEVPAPPKYIPVKDSYPTLRSLSSVFFFVAWLVFLTTAIVVTVELNNLGDGGSWGTALLTMAVGLVAFALFLAISEVIKVLLDIEANTRRS